MATIQEAYKGVLERGEAWRTKEWRCGSPYLIKHKGSVFIVDSDGTERLYCPSVESIIRDDWERVPPLTPRPIYLMIPCEKGKGTHVSLETGTGPNTMWYSHPDGAAYRQVPMPLTVEDMLKIKEKVNLAGLDPVYLRLNDTINLMKEAK